MEIRDAIATGSVLLDLKADDLRAALERTLDILIGQGQLSPALREEVMRALLSREIVGNTAIGLSVAVPHAHLDALSKPIIAFIRLARPLHLGAPDGLPTRFLFVLLGPKSQAAGHLQTLMKIARLMSDAEFRDDARRARSREELLAAVDRFVERTTPELIHDESPAGDLVFTGKFAGGLVRDLKRRLAHYRDDWLDGLHPKSISSILFMFFACMAPAVAFGGLMAVMTGNQIGVVEMLAATAACGVVYALVSGQPLTILAGTGPILIFTGMLYDLTTRTLGLPPSAFLSVYAWVGLWSALYLLLLAVCDGSVLIRYLTRFTDEIFAALIAMVFIYEAVKDLVHIFTDQEVGYDSALLSLLLAVGTYNLAMGLARFRRSRYLRPWCREFLADFGPTIALGVMTLVAVWVNRLKPGEITLTRLLVPDTFGTTSPRPWLVNPFAAPVWLWFAAAGPALLVTVLIFLEQNIATRLVSAPENKLKKGSGYHLNGLVLGLLIGTCSLFGLPWLVASVIISLNHLRSLATVEESVSATGEVRERVVHVRENRVTPLAIHLLIGMTLLLLPYLRLVPMSVLFGLFLYMGVASLTGNNFYERLKLWVMDPALYPSIHYIRRVPFWTVHKYTFLQLVCLAVLWGVKSSPLGILFPLFVALLVPVRLLAERFFAHRHLASLDAEEEPDDDSEPPPEIATPTGAEAIV